MLDRDGQPEDDPDSTGATSQIAAESRQPEQGGEVAADPALSYLQFDLGSHVGAT
jgi:hypothetical protein